MNFERITEASLELVTQWGLKVLGAIAVLIIGRMIAG